MKQIKIKISYRISKQEVIEVEHEFDKDIFDQLDIDRAISVSLAGAISELKRKLNPKNRFKREIKESLRSGSPEKVYKGNK
jgi:hypothetical protein